MVTEKRVVLKYYHKKIVVLNIKSSNYLYFGKIQHGCKNYLHGVQNYKQSETYPIQVKM